MTNDDIGKEIRNKSLELKDFFKGVRAVLEQWKFSVEETKEGTRIEVHAIALVRHPKNGKAAVPQVASIVSPPRGRWTPAVYRLMTCFSEFFC
jgi:hypothetical protein